MGRLYFVRHGETYWNVENKICGATDIALTPLGHEQAIRTAEEIVRSSIRFDEILSSLHEESRKMNEGFGNLAERYGTGFVNTGFWNIPLCFDMVHFSEEGHRMFAEKIGKYLTDSF